MLPGVRFHGRFSDTDPFFFCRFDRNNCTRVEHNTDVPDFLLANAGKYAYMLDRDPPNANFRDVDVSKGLDSSTS